MEVLLLCILVNVCIGIIFKLYPRYGINTFQAIIFNYYTCLIVGTIQMRGFPIPADFYTQAWFPFVIILSFFFIIGFNLNAIATQRIGISYTTIIQKLSLIIPSTVGIIFFAELPSTLKILGISLAIPAIILIQLPVKGQKIFSTHQINKKQFILLASGVFIIAATIELFLFYMSKKGITAGSDIQVVSSIFGFAGTIGACILIGRLITGRSKFHPKNIFAGVLLGIPNFYSIYLLVYLLESGWEASRLFPVNNVGIIALAAIAALIIFNERLNIFQWLGLTISILAIVFISL